MAKQSKEAVTLLKELLKQKSSMLSESTRDFHSKICPTGAPAGQERPSIVVENDEEPHPPAIRALILFYYIM